MIGEALQDAHQNLMTALKFANLEVNVQKSVEPGDLVTAFNIELSKAKPLTITAERLQEMQDDIRDNGPSSQSAGIFGYIRTVNADQAKLVEQAFPDFF